MLQACHNLEQLPSPVPHPGARVGCSWLVHSYCSPVCDMAIVGASDCVCCVPTGRRRHNSLSVHKQRRSIPELPVPNHVSRHHAASVHQLPAAPTLSTAADRKQSTAALHPAQSLSACGWCAGGLNPVQCLTMHYPEHEPAC